MPAKKKKYLKSDHLKLAAAVSLTVIFVSNLYLWWDSAEPMTSLSSSISALWWSLLIPMCIFVGALLFWLLMAVDSWQNKKFIWFFFILIGPLLIGLLYFIVEKPKILKQNAHTLGWLAIALLFFSWLFITISELKERTNTPTPVNGQVLVSFKGSLISKDSDGPGIYQIKTGEGVVRIDVGPYSSCDPLASDVPDLEAGDKVIVQAIENGNKSYSVCESDTYIRNL